MKHNNHSLQPKFILVAKATHMDLCFCNKSAENQPIFNRFMETTMLKSHSTPGGSRGGTKIVKEVILLHASCQLGMCIVL